MNDNFHQFLREFFVFLPKFLRFLPLFVWAVFAFGVLYSLLESRFRPLAVLWASVLAGVRIVTEHRRVAGALFALFLATPIVEAVSLFVVKLEGQPLLLTAFVWQGFTAGAIAWIATYIHGLTLPLPHRNTRELRRYRVMSLVAGVTLFLLQFVLASVFSLGLQWLRVPAYFQAGYLTRVLQTLIFVPMALVRPALSLGLRGPVRNALLAAAKPPFILAVWVTALGLPTVVFEWLGVDILRAHYSVASIVAYQVVRAAFSVAACVFFETTTLLLLARESKRFELPDEKEQRRSIGSGAERSSRPGAGVGVAH